MRRTFLPVTVKRSPQAIIIIVISRQQITVDIRGTEASIKFELKTGKRLIDSRRIGRRWRRAMGRSENLGSHRRDVQDRMLTRGATDAT